MLDLKRIRLNFDDVNALIRLRGNGDYGLEELKQLDILRRKRLTELETKKARHNKISKTVQPLKLSGQNVVSILEEMRCLSEEIRVMDNEIKELDLKIEKYLLNIPNLICEDTPNSDKSEVLRKYGEIPSFDFEPKSHWDLGTSLGNMDFERATKLSGSRFVVLKGTAAKLERALISFMMDLHCEVNHYTEVATPYLVHRDMMLGTGQLPKFENDMFRVDSTDLFLIPTGEVTLTNLYRDEILDESALPINHVTVTPCFRKEVGSSGKDTKGIIRQHQFNKVELVKFVHPKCSYEELEELTRDAEEVLKRLKLPYRVVRLCSSDVGFSATMTYDIEVWLPSYGDYLEISSCSNFEDYQARRANIRFRESKNKKVQFLHTLNGSGLAVGRTLAAIFENYQNEDGSINVPEVLISYLNGTNVIVQEK